MNTEHFAVTTRQRSRQIFYYKTVWNKFSNWTELNINPKPNPNPILNPHYTDLVNTYGGWRVTGPKGQ